MKKSTVVCLAILVAGVAAGAAFASRIRPQLARIPVVGRFFE